MSMRTKLFPPMLFCHSNFSAVGFDKTSDIILIVDPYKTFLGCTEIFALGKSAAKTVSITKSVFFNLVKWQNYVPFVEEKYIGIMII